MDAKNCIRCNHSSHTDNMTTDAFGDSSVQMCISCLYELRNDNSRFLLVEVPDIEGNTFVFKQELEHLKQYVGPHNVILLT